MVSVSCFDVKSFGVVSLYVCSLYFKFSLGCCVATFWEIADRSVSNSFSLYFVKQKKRPSVLKCQSIIASKSAAGMRGYTIIKNKHLEEQLKITDLSAFMSGPGCLVNTMNRSSEVWWLNITVTH